MNEDDYFLQTILNISSLRTIPDRTKETIDNYVSKKWKPGHFVTAVLANDLKGAVGSADWENKKALFEIVAYVYNEVPHNLWGSYEIVERWLSEEETQG